MTATPESMGDGTRGLLTVVNAVREGRARTRPDLTRTLDFGRNLIAHRVDEAIRLGFIEESDLGVSTGGRAPRTLRFRSQRGVVAVCIIGRLHVEIGIANLDGEILTTDSFVWGFNRGPEATLSTLTQRVDTLMAASHPGVEIWGVVVGLPGAVDFSTGRPVVADSMPEWHDFDVRGRFAQRYRAPVWADNEVNLRASIAAVDVSGAQRSADVIYLKVGTGVGAAFVFGGEVHRGAQGAAGEIGHFRVEADRDVRCFCGQRNCLESLSAGWAIIRDVDDAIAGGEPSMLASLSAQRRLAPADVALAASQFDGLAVRAIGESAVHVGRAVAAMANALNPSHILTGGSIAAADAFQIPFARTIDELATSTVRHGLTVSRSSRISHEALHGGVRLALTQLFEVTFPTWYERGTPTASG